MDADKYAEARVLFEQARLDLLEAGVSEGPIYCWAHGIRLQEQALLGMESGPNTHLSLSVFVATDGPAFEAAVRVLARLHREVDAYVTMCGHGGWTQIEAAVMRPLTTEELVAAKDEEARCEQARREAMEAA